MGTRTMVMVLLLVMASIGMAYGRNICQPGRWPYPVYMSTNVGPDAISSNGTCNYGTSTFEATNGCWITAWHVASDAGMLLEVLGMTMINPGLAAFSGGCSLNHKVNQIGYVYQTAPIFPHSSGRINYQDSVEVCGGDVQPELLELGIPSEYVPSKYPEDYPAAYYGATSCLIGGYLYFGPRTLLLNDSNGETYKFVDILEFVMSSPSGGDAGSLVITASNDCHMAWGMLETKSNSRVTLSNGYTGYPTWVLPLNPVLTTYNVGLAGGNRCTIQQLGPQLGPPFPAGSVDAVDEGDVSILAAAPGGPMEDTTNPILHRPWTPRPNEGQIQYEERSLAVETQKPEFMKSFEAAVKALGLGLVSYGPYHVEKGGTLYDSLPDTGKHVGGTVLTVGVTNKVTQEKWERFEEAMQSTSDKLGYPIVLFHEDRPKWN